MEFKTIEDLVRYFAERLAGASEEDKPAIEAERTKAERDFFAAQARQANDQLHQRELTDLRARAISQFPRANAAHVRGETEEEILQSAKESHEHVEAAIAAERERLETELRESMGSRFYGRSATGGTNGGRTVNSDPLKAEEERVDIALAKVQSGHGIVTEADEMAILRNKVRPIAAKVDFNWVAEVAQQTGRRVPTPEELLR